MKIFENLPKEDLQLLIDAPMLITILIGSADGQLDEEEKEWGDKLTHVRETTEERILRDYYEKASENFEERMNETIASLSKDIEERNQEVSKKLSRLNEIYTHIDMDFVAELNKSLRTFAHSIAQASGGILGFGSESYDEKQWVDLSMIKK